MQFESVGATTNTVPAVRPDRGNEQEQERKGTDMAAKVKKQAAACVMADNRKIVRTYSAGVFFGEVESRNGQEVVMRNARRLWYWDGAASLSQLAQEGTVKPENCKFPVAVDRVKLLNAIEILDTTPAARASIDGVQVWKR